MRKIYLLLLSLILLPCAMRAQNDETKSDTELGGLTVSGNTGYYGKFQYGDTITVTFTPQRSEGISTNALAENTATLTYTSAEGEGVTLATATAQADGSFTLTYDTREKKLPCKDNMTLTVSYGGSGELNPAEKTATISLESATLKNLPTVTGKFEFGQTLTAHYEKQDDETVTYQWLRDGANLTGATEITYTLTEEDIGKNIEVKVIASDYWHYGSRASNHQMVVAKATGSIAISCANVTYGETIQPTVTNTTNEGADVTYSYSGTEGTSYGPSNEPPTAAGSYSVTATIAETTTHTAATSELVTFTIARATLSPDDYIVPTDLTATYGQALEDVDLPDGWAWKDETQSVGEAGEHQFTAIFTPEDTDNYNTVEDEVTITVNQADISEQIKAESDTNISLDLETESLTLTAYVEGEGISGDGEWTWESDDESVAIVEEIQETRSAVPQSSRKVILVSEGTATITATYSDGTNYSGSVDFTITVTAKEEEPAPKPDPQPQPDPTPIYYNIQFEDICEGVDASLSKSVVKEGNQVSVYIEVEEGYDAENMKVMFKRSLYGYWEEVSRRGLRCGEHEGNVQAQPLWLLGRSRGRCTTW